MKVRAITVGLAISWPLQPPSLAPTGAFMRQAGERLQGIGFEVQTTRLATQPFPVVLAEVGAGAVVELALALQAATSSEDIGYCSIGPAHLAGAPRPASQPWLAALPEAMRATDAVFATVGTASREAGVDLWACRRAAEIIAELARTTDLGFGNLRFSAIANCPPDIPFFPAGYHGGGPPVASVAVEAADVAVDVFSRQGSLREMEDGLVERLDDLGGRVAREVEAAAAERGWGYGGIDFSLAPFPADDRSIGNAIEQLGVERFGASGTLLCATLVTHALRRLRTARCGFSGLMLPVLEDSRLALRSGQGSYTVDDLLMYSAVCGTGLDCVPLPGDSSAEELAALLADVSALAVALDKPLTARLLPVPGKRAGDATSFDFPYFANGTVLPLKGLGARRLFEREGVQG